MPKPFIAEEYIQWRDIERCPYAPKDIEWLAWSRADDERLLLIALDRYADKLCKQEKMSSEPLSINLNTMR